MGDNIFDSVAQLTDTSPVLPKVWLDSVENSKPYSPVRHLASAVFSFSDKAKYMLMLNAYFDETGDEKDLNVKIAGMAGCVAPAESWSAFEVKWQKALDNAGIQCFHMKEFAHSRGQFASG